MSTEADDLDLRALADELAGGLDELLAEMAAEPLPDLPDFRLEPLDIGAELAPLLEGFETGLDELLAGLASMPLPELEELDIESLLADLEPPEWPANSIP